jgi:hypothetical protein
MSEEAALHKFIDADQVKKDIKIDHTDINGALQEHAGLYQHYAGIAVRCRSQADRMKQNLELWENILDREHRTRLKEENPKVTEVQVKAAVVTDMRWRSASQRMIDADEQYNYAKTIERSFEHRREMLLQLARNLAREQEGPLRVVVNQDARQRTLEAMARNAEKTSSP